MPEKAWLTSMTEEGQHADPGIGVAAYDDIIADLHEEPEGSEI